MKTLRLIMIFLFFCFNSFAEDGGYCADLTKDFKKIREKLIDMPCSLLDENEGPCESFGDIEDEYKSLLAEHRLRKGIDALHDDLKKKKIDPELVLDNQKWCDFLTSLSTKMSLENSFIEGDNFLLSPTIEDPSHLDQLCEKPEKKFKPFCMHYSYLKTDEDKEKIINFSKDLKEYALSASDSQNIVSKEERLKNIKNALKEVYLETPKTFAMLYGVNVYITPNKDAQDPKTFNGQFKILDKKASFKKSAEKYHEYAQTPNLDKEQTKILTDLKNDLDIIDQGYTKQEFIKLTTCLYKNDFDNCTREHLTKSNEELTSAIDKKKKEMREFRQNRFNESNEIKKFMFAESFLLEEIREKCGDQYQEKKLDISCYDPETDLVSDEVHFLIDGVRGIVDNYKEEYQIDENGKKITIVRESASFLKDQVCSFKEFEEMKLYCPRKSDFKLTDLEKLQKDLKQDDKQNKADMWASQIGALAANTLKSFQPVPAQTPYIQTNWNQGTSLTPLGYNPFALKDSFGSVQYNPSGYNWYQPNLYGQSAWGAAMNPYERGFEYQPPTWLDAGY